MSDNVFDHIDHARLERHSVLLEQWRELSAEELLTDLNVLVQFLAFRYRRDLALMEARVAHRTGGTHECGEWIRKGQCQVCGRVD